MSADELQAKLASEPEEAARWIYAAAAYGSAPAQITWGQMLLDGHGVKADAATAFRWFNIAALSGWPDGLNMVGRCYEFGWGIAPDPAEAARWYRDAAGKGHAWAQYNLATLMLKGQGIVQDPRAALSLLVRSARQGNAKAMNMIGRYRETGWVGPIKIDSAIRWYRRAAERGCYRGSFHLGRFLMKQGKVAEAASRFACAVDNAHAEFCRDAAEVLLGHAEPEIQAVGRRALARAAETGLAADLYAYGKALAEGRGGPFDFERAKAWLIAAQAHNYPGAEAAIQDVKARSGSAPAEALRNAIARLVRFPVRIPGA